MTYQGRCSLVYFLDVLDLSSSHVQGHPERTLNGIALHSTNSRTNGSLKGLPLRQTLPVPLIGRSRGAFERNRQFEPICSSRESKPEPTT